MKGLFQEIRSTRSELRGSLLFVVMLVVFLLLKFSEETKPPTQPIKSNASFSVSTTIPVVSTVVSTTRIVLWPEPTKTNAQVTRVIDGDTVDVLIDGMVSTTRVRLLGINTPESVDPRRPVQCFGKEASRAVKDMVEGKRVALLEDLQADDRDRYGRWLRTLVSEEGMDINATLVFQGYAHAYVDFPLTKTRRAQLRMLQSRAETDRVGLWNEATCAGETYN